MKTEECLATSNHVTTNQVVANESVINSDTSNRDATRDFLQDVLIGLGQDHKTLPSKYFYDDRGSQLFEQICALEEYYLTRTEMDILQTHGEEIVEHYARNLCMIEPGAGAGKKAAILLAAMGGGQQFVPLEISSEALNMSRQYLSTQFPDLTIHPIHGDFTRPDDVQRAADEITSEQRLVFFPGSTLGNFEQDEAEMILTNLRQLMGEQGSIVIGLDLIKDEQRLLAAYDDKRGVTADFNKNLLERINHELGADFDCDTGFEHRALFNTEQQRIEMHLCSTRQQSVVLAGNEFYFAEGETIHTENSHKYSLDSVQQLCEKTQLKIDKFWSDKQRDFGVFRLSNAA